MAFDSDCTRPLTAASSDLNYNPWIHHGKIEDENYISDNENGEEIEDTNDDVIDHDDLSVKEAFVTVLKEKEGYFRGLGPQPPKNGWREGESNEARVQLTSKVQLPEEQEVALHGEIGDLKSSNDEFRGELKRMKQ